jgi:hypothetical protein
MTDNLHQALLLSQKEAITLAEKKLNRLLSPEERKGIENIRSLMMLESMCQAYASPICTPEEVLKDLDYFSTKTAT